jgi:hypothetical protein
MLTYSELQTEIKRRATRDQGGTTFDGAIRVALNRAYLRISREALWRQLRRTTRFTTKPSYTTGTANLTTSSAAVSFVGSTFLTEGIEINRRVKFSSTNTLYYIREVVDETSLVIDKEYSADSSTGNTYEIYPQGEYILPMQCGHRVFLWHEEYGYPYLLQYVPEQEFLGQHNFLFETGIPRRYTMWGEDMARVQIQTPGKLSVFSTSSSDTKIGVLVHGLVDGIPAYETIYTNASNGMTTANGLLNFETIERVTKLSRGTGVIYVTRENAAKAYSNNAYAIIPMGNSMKGVFYKRFNIFPLPNKEMTINVRYYKDVWKMTVDDELHELGAEFDEAIICLSVARIKAETNQQEASTFYKLYQDEIKILRRTNADKPDWFPTLKRPYLGSESDVHPQFRFRQAGVYYGPRVF